MCGEERLCDVLCLENHVWRKGGADAAAPDLRRSSEASARFDAHRNCSKFRAGWG